MWRHEPVGAARSAPYGAVTRPGAQKPIQSDAVKLAALEQLLRTIAERANSMTTAEILALNAAFSVASSSSTSLPSLSTASVSAPTVTLQHGPPVGGAPIGSAGGSGGDLQGSTGPLPTLDEVGGGLNTVKVSAKTNVKSVAGAISKALRSNEMIVATAYGQDGANHGMKAISIARCYLAAEGLDLSATVVEVQPDPAMTGPNRCYAFIIVRISVQAKVGEPLCEAGVGRTEPLPRAARPEGQQTDMKVSGQGNVQALAGAISKCLREDREIIITAVGPASVGKCVEAMTLARNHVWQDGLQLAFYPGFEHIIMQGTGPGAGEQRCCVRVHVWPESAEPNDPNPGAGLTAGATLQFHPR